MKEPFDFRTGRVVQSTQGRDKGYFFVVTENAPGGLVMIADGFIHRLSHPKKKKTKHLRAKPMTVDMDRIRSEGGKVQDSDLRRTLDSLGLSPQRSLRKEG